MTSHSLSWLLAVPAISAIVVLLLPRSWEGTIRRFAIGAMLVELLLSLRLIFADYSDAGFLFVEQISWVESFGISYKVGVDGLSLWLVILTTLLSPIALYASWGSIKTRIKEYAFSFLLLELGMLGAFVALDLFLFYVFWELMLVPMYLIIGVWGGKDRVYAAVKFFIYTMVGSLLMLVAILYVVTSYKELAGHYSFDVQELSTLVLPAMPQYLLFSAFALAFAIKVPLLPFHTWLADAHTEAPTSGSVLLAGVLLKMGTYGLLRFGVEMFPAAALDFAPLFMGLGALGIVYGALLAMAQTDLKRLIACSSVSHLGFVVLGLFAMTQAGLRGSVLQMVNHGISTGALFLMVGWIYERRHTREIADLKGIQAVAPIFAAGFMVVMLSSIGVPGLNGFVGEYLILIGAFLSARWYVVIAATGVILAALYLLWAYQRVFHGEPDEENRTFAELKLREAAVLLPFIGIIVFTGVYPKPLLERIEPAVESLIENVSTRGGFTVEEPGEFEPATVVIEHEGETNEGESHEEEGE